MEKLAGIIKQFEKARILVVGDIILDQYIWGNVERISPEAPIPVVDVVRESVALGGAANVANNIAAVGAKADICGLIGDDFNGRQLLEMLKAKNIGADAVLSVADRMTTLKSRVVAHKQQIVRVDRENKTAVTGPLYEKMIARIEAALPEVDALILEDYGKGIIHEALLKTIVPMAREAGKIITVDPKKDHFDLYQGVTAITPNQVEAEGAAGVTISSPDSLDKIKTGLLDRLQCQALLITLGEKGMCLLEQGRPPLQIPARAREVYDVSGAGDTVIAVFTTALVAGATLREAAMLSNLAGGMVVEKLGTATITREELITRLPEIIS